MSFSFTVEIPSDVDFDRALEVARARAKENGVTFAGDTAKGTVNAKGVAGSYTIKDRAMSITIDKKPFFVSENMIINGVNDVIKNIDQHL
jgi:hypothetical protein